jgi:hypothetical protein
VEDARGRATASQLAALLAETYGIGLDRACTDVAAFVSMLERSNSSGGKRLRLAARTEPVVWFGSGLRRRGAAYIGAVNCGIWTRRALVALRQDRGEFGLQADVLSPPAQAESRVSVLAVRAVLAAMRATCLQRSLVLQAWLLSIGRADDLAVGVKSENAHFSAGVVGVF